MSEGEKLIFALIAIIGVSVVAWFRSTFGLDWPTSLQVAGAHGLFIGVIWIAISTGFEIVPGLIPVAIVGYLACWRPALAYWANSKMGSLGDYVLGSAYMPWYGNDWIQLGIASAIIVFGYFFIHIIKRY